MTRHILKQEVESDLMLYDIEEDSVHVLNKTARRIYELCMEAVVPEHIETLIRQDFAVDPDMDIREDIHACLDELRQKGLIEMRVPCLHRAQRR